MHSYLPRVVNGLQAFCASENVNSEGLDLTVRGYHSLRMFRALLTIIKNYFFSPAEDDGRQGIASSESIVPDGIDRPTKVS